ncbi:hypothetical protein Goshw_002365 [Gossypium schwendimanii]|uniref:Uncharacterized protein n=1 Tax=Gossypium schwendimanii TaxID=34291 RepID=A0A7J9LJU7_GOSSC|nr:hypothetical protein [Gossypium schwendimanii]
MNSHNSLKKIEKKTASKNHKAILHKETKGEFGWAVRLPAVSVKTAVAVRSDTVVTL